METIVLNSGKAMPRLGFGVWQVENDAATDAVRSALEAGYTSIDTAAIYGNEAGVGKAIARSGIDRSRLFITTKLWNDAQGFDTTLRAFDQSLERLGLDYVDLYLIHWPSPARNLYGESWRAMIELYKSGRARSIGVSNFQTAHLKHLLDTSDVVPAVNQIELHPLHQQRELRAFHAEHGIATEAWSPLAQGGIDIPVIAAIAQRLGRTPAQVILRWHLQTGNIAIPKSVTPSRIRENIDVFDFTLGADDMAAIDALDADKRLGPHPDEFNI